MDIDSEPTDVDSVDSSPKKKRKEKKEKKFKTKEELESYEEFSQILEKDDILTEICNLNGISKTKLVKQRENITEIEIFMCSISKISSLDYFTNLKKLTITAQGINKIENLNNLIHLEYLWLNENNITKIENLSNNSNIVELYLYENKIKKIEGLSNLSKLEVLWLSDNSIEEIENIDNLKNLRVLHLSKNRIETIEDKLDRNQKLEELNLGGNFIKKFREIPFLTKLKKLKFLTFRCEIYGENPICNLCNYQTYILYHLSQIKQLDSMLITEEARRMADSTFFKKKMYYNMRTKALKRNCINIIKKANFYLNKRKNELILNLNMIYRIKKEIEKELDDFQNLKKRKKKIASYDALEFKKKSQIDTFSVELMEKGKTNYENSEINFFRDLNLKNKIVNEYIKQKNKEFEDLKKSLILFSQDAKEICSQNICRLMVELETGGNIRIEDGKNSDFWYKSCVDLIKSRFFEGEFLKSGIKDFKVHRVSRIHNRLLRNRFEDRLENKIDVCDQNYKKQLEYLFYSEFLDKDSNIYKIIEEGFDSFTKYKRQNGDEGINLTNSLAVCEESRLKREQESNKNFQNDKSSSFGKILVLKVFLGNFSVEYFQKKSKKSLLRTDYQEFDSVYRIKSEDKKQRLWFVFDNILILPEYLIEYELIKFEKNEKKNFSDPFETITKEMKPNNEGDLNDFKSFAISFFNFIKKIGIMNEESEKEYFSNVLNESPILKKNRLSISISEKIILKKTKFDNLKNVTYLNFFDNKIKKIEGLENLLSLKILNLSYNEISKMEGLNNLIKLEILDLSANLLKKVEGIKTIRKLRILYLNNNLLNSFKDLNIIERELKNLEEINLKFNPICDHDSYEKKIIEKFSNLKIVDEEEFKVFKEKNKEVNDEIMNIIDEKKIFKNSFSRKRFGYSLYLNLMKKPFEISKNFRIEDLNWCNYIIELDLSKQKLKKIENLEKLKNLKVLNLNENRISLIENLDSLIKLEELKVENNLISKICGLTKLLNLKKLDLGKNKISKIENLDFLTKLVQLSLEDNEIDSIKGIEKLTNLMEIFVGNNKIKSLKEINFLKELPKLIILDVSGNEFEDNYRLYAIYILKKLKVLDGINIDSSEILKSKEEFSGRMTTELLFEKIGHSQFNILTDLDLSTCNIKSIINLNDFFNLKKLNLEHNQITSAKGIQNLSSLIILRLSYNKLGSNECLGNYFENLKNLEVLMIDSNGITGMISLQLFKLKSLKALSLRNNEIQKIEGLEGCEELQELFIDRNKIKIIDENSFDGLKNLRELRMEENSIKSLSGIKKISSLNALYMGCNRINDLSEIEKLVGLVNLKEIILNYNPISRKASYRPNLIHLLSSLLFIDGKEITIEERDKVRKMFYAPEYFQHFHSVNDNNYNTTNIQTNFINTNNFIGNNFFTAANPSKNQNSIMQNPNYSLGTILNKNTNLNTIIPNSELNVNLNDISTHVTSKSPTISLSPTGKQSSLSKIKNRKSSASLFEKKSSTKEKK